MRNESPRAKPKESIESRRGWRYELIPYTWSSISSWFRENPCCAYRLSPIAYRYRYRYRDRYRDRYRYRLSSPPILVPVNFYFDFDPDSDFDLDE
jgi:hypothetical protein